MQRATTAVARLALYDGGRRAGGEPGHPPLFDLVRHGVAPARAGGAPARREHLRARAGRRRDRRRRGRGGGARPAVAGAPAQRARARHRARDRRGLQREPRRARVRAHGPRGRLRRRADRAVLRSRCAWTSAQTEHDEASFDALRLRLGRGRRADVPAGLRARRRARLHARTSSRRSRPARVRSARRSRRSTSCATSPPTSRRSAAATSRASTSPRSPTPQKNALLDDIDADLALGRRAPSRCCRAARAARSRSPSGLFAELSRRLRATPAASTLIHTRVRVPDPVKLRIALAAASSRRGRSRS